MCGLCGELRFNGVSPDTSVIERMKIQLAKRGPDSEGAWADGPMALGHRRLSIIDLRPEGAQPMTNEDDSISLVVNGEFNGR